MGEARFGRTPAERLMLLEDLYAPMDEEGVRHPGHGVITLGQFAALINLETEQSDSNPLATRETATEPVKSENSPTSRKDSEG